MNRKNMLILLFLLYALLWLLFLKESFTLTIYTSCSGKMLSKKEAILVCSKKPVRKIGYIHHKKYTLKVTTIEKKEKWYYANVFFQKEQATKEFVIYFKKEEKTIWKLLKEEWRMS